MKYAFLLLLALVPFPFASNRPWSWGLMAVAVAGLLIAEGVTGVLREKEKTILVRPILPSLFLFLIPVAVALLQLGYVTPASWNHPIWSAVGFDHGSPTMDPAATTDALMRLLAYGGVFWLSFRLCQREATAKLFMTSFLVIGLGYAFYGLLAHLSGSASVLWFDKWAYQKDLTSTFINRNSYATYAGLGLLIASALLYEKLSQEMKRFSRNPKIWILVQQILGRHWLQLMGVVLLAIALLLTHSRGGFLSTGVGLLVLLLAIERFSLGRLWHHKKWVGGFLAGAILLFALSGAKVDERLNQTSLDRAIRDEVYLLTTKAAGDNFWLGTGYGTFQQAFLLYKDSAIYTEVAWDKAHNTYLELAMELGVPAAIALVAAVVWLVFLCFRGVRHRRRDYIYPAVGLSATALVGTHALVDFSLQIPAVAVTYAAIMGLAVAQSFSTKERNLKS